MVPRKIKIITQNTPRTTVVYEKQRFKEELVLRCVVRRASIPDGPVDNFKMLILAGVRTKGSPTGIRFAGPTCERPSDHHLQLPHTCYCPINNSQFLQVTTTCSSLTSAIVPSTAVFSQPPKNIFSQPPKNIQMTTLRSRIEGAII